MDTSVASLNRSTFEERQKNVSYLRSLYFLLALQLLIAVAWSLVVINTQSIKDWVRETWGLALALEIVAVLILLAVFFVPALNKGGVIGIAIYVIFTLVAAYLWGYFCSLNEDNYGFYVLLLLTGIAIGFAAYTW
jgi:FtsH-binding integral membrane protein